MVGKWWQPTREMADRRKNGQFKPGWKGGPGRPRKERSDKSDAAAKHADGWSNVLTGIGMSSRDKRLSTSFGTVTPIDWSTALQLWRGCDLAARAIETWPNEMLREGFDLRIASGDKSDADKSKQLAQDIAARWDELGLTGALWSGLAGERGFGGAAILIGANDGATDLTQPLNMERVRSLDWLTVLEPRECTPVAWYNDPRAPKFGLPAIYRINPHTKGTGPAGRSAHVEVHESRLIIFPGIRVSRLQTELDGWGDSILTRMYSVLRDFDMSWSAAAILVQDFSQAVFKMSGLAELIANDRNDVVANRMAAVDLSRSVARAILIDAEGEDFERKETPLTGLPELLDRFATRLAAAADMPLTLLMGQSPGGLNATGESDIRFFYDRVAAAQQRKLKPAIERITTILFRTMGQEPDQWSIEFRPLWQPTEKEQAEARYIQAQTDQIYLTNGVVSPEEVCVSRFTGDGYSFDTQVDLSVERESEVIADEPEPDPFAAGGGGDFPPEKAE